MDDSVDQSKRAFLRRATTAVGTLGLVGAAYPFLSSMAPSRAANENAKPVRVHVNSMKEGEQKTVIWRGKPVWIIRRSADDLAKLSSLDAQLSDPNSSIPQQPSYVDVVTRSIRPELLVLVGVCTHLGCAPTYRPEPGAIDKKWPGGFFCSCHGSKFDLAGRVYKGVPAPTNLEVPPHRYLADGTLIVGENPGETV
ncbi:MAG TPA: ubiquinol-cytochrome c reductase iron-sulfur subunit [Gammaproteobacteria bacterium]|nr:ubiquinol-cytochrome c reductase iron-sulfur subunit [Gammaproteobacteria bacterium]